jgi:hypothetical protein
MAQTRHYDGVKPAEPTPQESRQGEIGRDGPVRGPMRYVLIVSTVLAIILLIVAYFAT